MMTTDTCHAVAQHKRTCHAVAQRKRIKYKITIEYDGTNYVGWQKQPDQPNRSIEELIENAIFAMSDERPKLSCAGRTDAGVHALGQVADFSLNKEFTPRRIVMGLNRHLLDHPISILDCEIVDEGFHARFNAKSRTYQYHILNRCAKPSIDLNRAWHVPTPLDVDLMNEAAQYLIGEHDFSSFRDSKCQSNTPIKEVKSQFVFTCEYKLIIEITAKSFLHHMVRNIVGTLYLVGSRQIAPDEFKKILEAKDRTKSGQNAPACGLYFKGVEY